MEGPLRYPVVIHNDDCTPFSVVVQVVNEIFGYAKDDALELTDKIHNEGSVVLGDYIYEIADAHVSEVHRVNEAYDLDIKVCIDTSAEKAQEQEDQRITQEILENLLEEIKKDEDDE